MCKYRDWEVKPIRRLKAKTAWIESWLYFLSSVVLASASVSQLVRRGMIITAPNYLTGLL